LKLITVTALSTVSHSNEHKTMCAEKLEPSKENYNYEIHLCSLRLREESIKY